MLDIKFVRDNFELVTTSLRNRGQSEALDGFSEYDTKRRAILAEVEKLKQQRNSASEKIAEMKREGKDASKLIAEMKAVAARIKGLDGELAEQEQVLRRILMGIPNVPHSSVPVGRDSDDNPVIKKVGPLPEFDFDPVPHWDLGERLGILDFERAAKITGARFTLYVGLGARLERALINFMLDIQTKENGYLEVLPPFMTNQASTTATGQLPKFESDLFKLEGWDYYLVPTA
jgi:seryl-tRNA synthetase